jgi:hypothetical protein
LGLQDCHAKLLTQHDQRRDVEAMVTGLRRELAITEYPAKILAQRAKLASAGEKEGAVFVYGIPTKRKEMDKDIETK